MGYSYWKLSDWTKAELDRLDQEEFRNLIYMFKHSPAAIQMFVRLQMLGKSKKYFAERMTIAKCISDLSLDIINSKRNRFFHGTPWHIEYVTAAQVLRCSRELGYETKLDESGDELLVRTIVGWSQI